MNPRPQLRTDLVFVEQTYRGARSYIVKDPTSHKYFRFRPLEVAVMRTLDGSHTLEEAVAALADAGIPVPVAALSAFARKLGQMGLLVRSLGERSVLQLERLRSERRRRLRRGPLRGNLLRLRWSVGDPDRLFDRWMPRLRFLFSPTFLRISVALFAVYFLVLGLKWGEFTDAIARLYDPSQYSLGFLATLWLTGLVIVAVHELGHGFTCKYFGGQVHEIGAMLIYFQPAFFCNVNDAWTFPERRARLWVTAAGSWIQLVLAGIAAVVWWIAAPGTLLSEIALAAVIIGGVTTVAANLNPLIPLDGYYALSDYLEVPNLRHRAFGYIAWRIKHDFLGLDLLPPPADDREQRIFLVYGAVAAAYIAILLGLIAFLALGWISRALGVLGISLALFAGWLAIRPQVRAWAAAVADSWREHRLTSRIGSRRRRLLGAAAGLLILGLVIPRPIVVEGVFIAAPALMTPVTAPDSGTVERVWVAEGAGVELGAPLVQLRNWELARGGATARRIADSLDARLALARAHGAMGEVARLNAQWRMARARSAGLETRLERLTLRAGAAGVILTARPDELFGRSVGAGDTVVAVGAVDGLELRISLAGAGAAQVRPGQTVWLLSRPTMRRVRAVVAGVGAVAGTGDAGGAIEARVRIPAAPAAGWRPGMTGEARVVIARSNLLGAFWWTVRQWIRSDFLL